MKSRTYLSLALAALLLGCSANPMTGRSQLMLVSETNVIAQAKSAYVQELAPWQKKGRIDNQPDVVERVNLITNRLIAQAIRYRPDTAKWDWQVKVIDEPETLNAYCLPGGRMAIYTGLINKLKATDAEIAQVMGHEIAHALANHGAEKMSHAMAAQTTVALATALAGQKYQGAVQSVGPMMAQLGWLLPNGRDAEREADTIGIELAARAGYDPKAGAELWKKMIAATGKSSGPKFLSTHPPSEERMQKLAALADYMMPIYAEARARPLPSYSGLPSNVRDVSAGGSQLAAVPAAALSPLTLISPAFEDFKRGQAGLKCDDCAIAFQKQKDTLRKLHEGRKWEALARAVLDIGYDQDIAWFYLAESARGLGLAESQARAYYQRAIERANSRSGRCKGSFLDLCNGIDLPRAAELALSGR